MASGRNRNLEGGKQKLMGRGIRYRTIMVFHVCVHLQVHGCWSLGDFSLFSFPFFFMSRTIIIPHWSVKAVLANFVSLFRGKKVLF